MTPDEITEADLPFDQLPKEEQQRAKASIAECCHEMLESHRDAFVLGPWTFAAAVWREPNTPEGSGLASAPQGVSDGSRTVSATVIRRVLDWAENEWPMSLGDFLSGMFYGKEWDRKTPPWQLVPTTEQRITAESLGFGHLYPTKEKTWPVN